MNKVKEVQGIIMYCNSNTEAFMLGAEANARN